MSQWPRTDEMLEWIRTIVARGIRRPGYPADAWTEQWAARKLRAYGLDVELEPVRVPRWVPRSAELTVRRDGQEASGRGELRVEGFPLPFTAPSRGTTAPLVRLADAPAHPGALAVDELRLTELPQAYVRSLATSSYDPEGVFDTLVQTLPFGPRLNQVVEPALAAKSAGYVGALDFPWETRDYYVPYDAVERPIPGLWLRPSDTRRVLDLMDKGPCTGTLTSSSRLTDALSHNVVATLPGASDHWVIIASHHDAPWASAVEDGTGIALVLAAARHWAGVPREQRPHNLLFLLTAGHMVHAAGTRAFIDRHRDLLPDVVLQMHRDHAALRCVPRDGGLEPTDDPEVRWWFTTQEPPLEQLVHQSIAAEGLRRSHVLRPDVFSPMPPTDGAFFHPEGVRLVHFLSAPMYLVDSSDTLDKVDAEGLLPLSRAAARIVRGTAGWVP
ncbi:M28 family peptidase [Streptomyces mesophilus]|uniref:M28 family peptidase n=1 Tax=Streptomyces mesophilus TaxID=1775132 RepID=UPI00331E90B4